MACWHSTAGWIKPARLVAELLAQPGITCVPNTPVAQLLPQGHGWQALDAHGQVLASADEDGPEQWQIDHLTRIGEQLRAGGDLGAVIEEDVSAGHGAGKSAVVSWVILWAISTHENTRGVVTANTDTQLRTKTWAEMSKWHQMSLTVGWATLTATRGTSILGKRVTGRPRKDCQPSTISMTNPKSGATGLRMAQAEKFIA